MGACLLGLSVVQHRLLPSMWPSEKGTGDSFVGACANLVRFPHAEPMSHIGLRCIVGVWPFFVALPHSFVPSCLWPLVDVRLEPGFLERRNAACVRFDWRVETAKGAFLRSAAVSRGVVHRRRGFVFRGPGRSRTISGFCGGFGPHVDCERILSYSTFILDYQPKQCGAAEACWAHNPEVAGSKPVTATLFF